MSSFTELLRLLEAEHERLTSAIGRLTSENAQLHSRLRTAESLTLNVVEEPVDTALELSEEPKTVKAPTSSDRLADSIWGRVDGGRSSANLIDGDTEVPEVDEIGRRRSFAHFTKKWAHSTFARSRSRSVSSEFGAARQSRSSMTVPVLLKPRSPGRLTVKQALASTDMRIAKTSSGLVINPEYNRFYMWWDFLSMMAMAYVAVIVPFQVGLLAVQWDWMFVLSSMVDLIFVVDMILQFFVMYPKRTDFGIVYESRHDQIIIRYLSSWFFLDFFSVIPFDLISLLSETNGLSKMKVIKVVRLLRLIKLIRVCKASKRLRRLEVVMSVTYQKMALYKFFALLALISHWLACCWALTLSLTADDGVPRWIDSLTSIESSVDVMSKDSPIKLYIASLYFTSYTITSVGYGDIGPKNVLERIVCTVMIYVCGISWAYVLGQVCGIVGNLDADEQTFRKSMDDLNIMMHERNFHTALRKRLRAFFLATREVQRHGRHRQLVSSMSPALQGEVAIELNRLWFTSVYFLREVVLGAKANEEHLPPYLVKVAVSLQASVHAQSEVFGKPQTFYVLSKGLASRRMRIVRVGDYWGEDFLLSNPNLVENEWCFALTYLELSNLSGEAFMRIVEENSCEFPEFGKRVRRYVVRLAVRRGILLEAKKRRRLCGSHQGYAWADC
eukprot:TRINITY_DN8905_c0_g1_i2.p1 TRINITY_DN8905_c0_g1~~TRINITY_DN8905_c0_g1_i2.p1  ORF type:complete len:734 (-),score=95.52 TRINITY_DN8905_c0_g1_i2:258-2270(-)